MNPNNYNAYGYPQFNVGSGWSPNNNFPMNNQSNQGQNFQNVGPPPPIGFVLPNVNQNNNNIPQYQGSQSNIDYSQYTSPVGIPGQNTPVYQTKSYNQSTPNSNTSNTQHDINQNIYEKQKFPTQPIKQEISSRPSQKQHANESTNDNKSDYQKGLDKLAELMNEDLTSEELKKFYKNSENN